jgi:hypothetical protein
VRPVFSSHLVTLRSAELIGLKPVAKAPPSASGNCRIPSHALTQALLIPAFVNAYVVPVED